MKNKTLLIISFTLLSLLSFGQESIEDLKKDIVSIKEDKWILSKLEMVTFESGDQKEMKFTAEATKDSFISRDNFIAISSEYLVLYSEKMGVVDYTDLTELVGEADITVKVYMSKAGIQIVLNNQGVETKETHLWKDYFSNN
jgi:hypothetical protein